MTTGPFIQTSKGKLVNLAHVAKVHIHTRPASEPWEVRVLIPGESMAGTWTTLESFAKVEDAKAYRDALANIVGAYSYERLSGKEPF